MACRLPILALLSLAAAPVLNAQRYSFRHYAHADGLDSLMVYSVVQDRTGFIWVATGNGLYRYEGGHFSAYSKHNGLPDHRVLAVHMATDGTLWVGTRFGFAMGGASPKTVAPNLRCSSPNCLASDAAGLVYAATAQGLMIANRGWRRIGHPLEAAGAAATSVYADSTGTVWFGCGRRLCSLAGSSLHLWGERSGVPADRWDAILRDQRGTVWIRSRTRLMRLGLGKAKFVEQTGIPPTTRYGSLFQDSAGALFVPSDLGLMRRVSEAWDRIGIENGLPTNSTSWVMEDREGSIWVGLSGVGLARWIGYGQWESWSHFEGLAGSSVRATLRTANGDLWIGTECGLHVRRRGSSRWRLYTEADGLAGNKVRALALASDGAIWVGSETGGLTRVDPRGSLAHIHSTIKSVRKLQAGRRSELWISADDAIYVIDDVAVPRPPVRRERLPATMVEPGQTETVNEILLDSHGRLWAAGGSGVWWREPGAAWRLHPRPKDAPISLLAEAPDGTMWAGSADTNTIFRLILRGGQVTPIPVPRSGARPADLSAIAVDSGGRLWVSTDDGLEIYDGKSWLHLRQEDGLLWNDCVSRALRMEGNGSVWVGTSQGLSIYHPSTQKPLPKPPAIITSLRVDNQVRRGDSEPRIPWRPHGSISIGFTGLTFLNEAAVHFRYRLLGLDDKWSFTDQRKVTYASLTAGQYTFEVHARNAYGTWSHQPARIAFVILPPWWQRWQVRAAAALFLGCLVVALWRWRVYRLVAERNRLETAVAERTEELALQHQRIASEKARAEEANQLKSQFLANMSHEVRTPMNAILGMTTLALEGQLEPQQREFLEIARLSAESLLDVLNDILDLSKMEAGKMEFEDEPFSLAKCVADAVATLLPSAVRKGLRLEYRIAPEVPAAVSGDTARLRQILLNLTGNAVKFTAEGEVRVTVVAESVEADAVVLRFAVSDTGIGISPEHQKAVFEAFRQADGSTTRKYGGTGLGLTICARLVELMQGRIWLESEPGRGSTCLFTARFRPAGPGEAEAVREESFAAGLRRLRVLLAEDNVVNQKLAVELLKRRGHSVAVVGTGAEAVRAAAEKAFDVVLMDVQMPEMDGLEAAAAIRRSEAGTVRHLPIVAMTAHAMKGDREKCLAAGMDSYISKPVNPAELFRVLEGVSGA